jgi:hypothetical protein
MPYFIVLLLMPIGVAVALYRRDPRRFVDGPAEDAPVRLLRWAIGLLSPERAEWGQAMLGEIGHIDGRVRRMRFALGCVGAALVLPPWGRAAAGVWAMIGLAVAAVGLNAGLAVGYRLGVGDWIAFVVVLAVCAAFLLGASALLRRPGIAVPGLIGGAFATLVTLAMTGFSAVDQVVFIPSPWQRWVIVIGMPAAVGVAAALWRRDPASARRVVRLAALSAGLAQLLYGNIAVAILGGGGPPDQDGGFTVRGTVGDRLGNNVYQLLFTTLFLAMVGWAFAAFTGYVLRRFRRTPAPTAGIATDTAQEA